MWTHLDTADILQVWAACLANQTTFSIVKHRYYHFLELPILLFHKRGLNDFRCQSDNWTKHETIISDSRSWNHIATCYLETQFLSPTSPCLAERFSSKDLPKHPKWMIEIAERTGNKIQVTVEGLGSDRMLFSLGHVNCRVELMNQSTFCPLSYSNMNIVSSCMKYFTWLTSRQILPPECILIRIFIPKISQQSWFALPGVPCGNPVVKFPSKPLLWDSDSFLSSV